MSQKLFVPSLGTLLVLAEDWTFRLFFERRNDSLLNALAPLTAEAASRKYRWGCSPEDFDWGQSDYMVEYERAMSEEQLADSYKSFRATNRNDNPFVRVTLPKGTQLSVDRIYVKRGGESFNSITFRTTKVGPEPKFRGKRFWVKLAEANEIVCDVVG